MKILLIGGTGVISTAITLRLINQGHEVVLLNRGKTPLPAAMQGRVRQLTADINDEENAKTALAGLSFDCVCNFVVYTPEQAQRDIRLFAGKTKQYVFVSTVTVYQKPLAKLPITEDMPLGNRYWKYSDLKAQCEGVYLQAYRETGFPVTIARPSHTYSERSLTVQIHGGHAAWVILKRMLQGKSIPVACDGMTLWTSTTSEDFAVYFCGLLGNEKAVGEAFHITSDEILTWNEIYSIIAEHLGAEFKPCYVPADVLAQSKQYDYYGSLPGDKEYSVMFDNSKVKRVTGIYDHKCIPFREGAKRSVEYFLTHPEIRQEDPAFEEFCDQLESIMQEATRKIK